MERKIYQPTEKQEQKWEKFEQLNPMPSDDEIKAHSGKKPWGLVKRDMILARMVSTREYQIGIWQARLDKLCGLDYSEERNENTYNLGYYRGYVNFESDWNGLDDGSKNRLLAQKGE